MYHYIQGAIAVLADRRANDVTGGCGMKRSLAVCMANVRMTPRKMRHWQDETCRDVIS